MLGALFGDINGSKFEFSGMKIYNFELWGKNAKITDDSLMTLAVAEALFICRDNLGNLEKLKNQICNSMKEIAHNRPDTNYGMNFYEWLFNNRKPYNSCGNGAGMRISPVGWVAKNEDEVKCLSKAITEVSHIHPEAIKGAEAIAMCVYFARIGKTKDFIRKYVADNYYPRIISLKYDDIWKSYEYDELNGSHLTCQNSVPESIVAFLDSLNFEDAVRKAVQYGGDSDTQACMTGAIAEAFYGIPNYYDIEDKVLSYLTVDLQSIYFAFQTIKIKK